MIRHNHLWDVVPNTMFVVTELQPFFFGENVNHRTDPRLIPPLLVFRPSPQGSPEGSGPAGCFTRDQLA